MTFIGLVIDGEIFYEGILDFKKLQSEFKLGRQLGKSEKGIYSVNDRLCYEATSNEYKNGKWIKVWETHPDYIQKVQLAKNRGLACSVKNEKLGYSETRKKEV